MVGYVSLSDDCSHPSQNALVDCSAVVCLLGRYPEGIHFLCILIPVVFSYCCMFQLVLIVINSVFFTLELLCTTFF